MTYQELGKLIAEFEGPVTCHVNTIGPVHVHKADLLMILESTEFSAILTLLDVVHNDR